MAFVKSPSPKGQREGALRQARSPYFSRAVAKALEILEILGGAREPLALNTLTAQLRLTKPSAFRLLATLEQTGYVIKESDGYVLNLGARHDVRDTMKRRLLEVAAPVLRELTRESRETTSVAMLFDNHIEVVAVVDSPQMLQMGNTVGRILQPHASSLGKCITAFQTEERREHLLRSYGILPITPHTITDENALEAEFASVRRVGHATDRGETCVDGWCFGASISNPGGEVFAAVSMSLPKSRLSSEADQARKAERVMEAARTITIALRSKAD